MPTLSSPNDSLVLSYLRLRKAIGIIGISLPFVLAIGKLIFSDPGIENSISAYYYTVMRDVFVGSLCAIAVFLISYRGYERIDEIAGKIAASFALGTALLPTAPANASELQVVIGGLHFAFALGFFLTLSFFAIVLFRKTNPNKPPTINKLKRNIVYTVCGYGILACIILILLISFLPSNSSILRLSPVFWLEALAIVLFGISWFVKGEAILKDA
jgi:hypothetical protein